MTLMPVKMVWWRSVQPGEFFNIERARGTITGGGGALYIEIPTSLVEETQTFLDLPHELDEQARQAIITARVIGDPELMETLEFQPKSGGRMRIANQNRQADPQARHPAWRADQGFPRAPNDVKSTGEAAEHIPAGGLRIYLVRTADDQYFAGFTAGRAPSGLAPDSPMERLYSPKGSGGIFYGGNVVETAELDAVFQSWQNGRNALLYGPPGTGKTRVLSQLFEALNDETNPSAIVLDPNDDHTPLRQASTSKLPIPTPVRTIWATFHQSYDYENFVIGLRPEIEDGSPTLQHQMGILLDAVYELVCRKDDIGSVVIFIDEINRGNAARIFGEVMTFLDFDYRATLKNGEDNPWRLPVSLPGVRANGEHTEDLRRIGGEVVQLPVPLYFPRDIYIVATMNSVDRAAVPIDSALARRFDRIEMTPNLGVLASYLGVDQEELAVKVRVDETDASQVLTAREVAVLLMDRVNFFIADILGSEFELGHGLFMSLSGDDAWDDLITAWDEVIFPQLEDRFAGRPDRLAQLLKVDEGFGGSKYAWRRREGLGGDVSSESIARVKLSALDVDDARTSLQWLVS